MELGILDHSLAVALLVALPVFGVWGHRRLERWITSGVRDARMRIYAMVMALEWTLSIVVVGLWLAADRSLPALGLGLEPGRGWWIGGAITLAVCALLVAQTAVVLRSREKLEAVRKQVEPLQSMLPHDDREARGFAALSVTAGICEELLYRGFFMAYLAVTFDTWLVVLASSLVFGLAHAYQGAVGVAKTAGVGLVMAGLYILSGSLWAPMLLHATIDLNSGHLGRRAVEQSPAD